jgi:LPS sulfotransferase NodH
VEVQKWLQRTPGVQMIGVMYETAVADPGATAARLAGFLGEPFHTAAAAQAVDPALRRQSKS